MILILILTFFTFAANAADVPFNENCQQEYNPPGLQHSFQEEKNSENLSLENENDLKSPSSSSQKYPATVSVYRLPQNYYKGFFPEGFSQREHFYCVNFKNENDSVSVSLIPRLVDISYCIFNKFYCGIFNVPEDVLKESNLIKTWEIPSNFVKDAIRRVNTDIKLLDEKEITIEYSTDKIVFSGGNLKYCNNSYTQYVLGFSSIIQEKKCASFEESLVSSVFREDFSYMHSVDAPTTIFTNFFGFPGSH